MAGPVEGCAISLPQNGRLDRGRFNSVASITIHSQGLKTTAEHSTVARREAVPPEHFMRHASRVMQHEDLAIPPLFAGAGVNFDLSGCQGPMKKQSRQE
jgi:hypothetical protein